MLTLAAFWDMFPDFRNVPAVTVERWLEDVAREVGPEYGGDQPNAHGYLTAHRMSLAGVGPHKHAAAFVGLESVNSGSLAFKVDKSMGDYGLTPYGRMFFPIFRTVRGGPLVTGTGDLPTPYGHAWHGDNGRAQW